MIQRSRILNLINSRLESFPVVAIVGARQVGKTTLARMVGRKFQTTFFDLENPRDLSRLDEPLISLEAERGLIVLDEIHHRPDLFPVLRVLVDRPGTPARFLVLGSASPELLRQSSETLAGRIAHVELGGFHLDEIGYHDFQSLWLRGGFPRSYLAESTELSTIWRQEFIRTFLERDLAAFGFRMPASTMRRFWTMIAHYHGQLWNGAELARAFGVSEKTVRHYLDLLCSTFMTRRLLPWHENLAKRQVKSPKAYLTDPGLLHSLLSIETWADLLGHPKRGASFEGFVIDQVARKLDARPEECFFWALHTGAELDFLWVRGQTRLGFEIKYTERPRVTPSMRSALQHLKLDRLDVVHPGPDTFPLAENVRAVALRRIGEDL